MDLKNKKYLVENYIKLAMDKESAYLLAELTDNEIEEVENDSAYQRKLLVLTKLEEKRLLNMYDKSMKIAAKRGNTSAIIKKLEIINPNRYRTTINNINENLNKNVDVELPPVDYSNISEEEAKELFYKRLSEVKNK